MRPRPIAKFSIIALPWVLLIILLYFSLKDFDLFNFDEINYERTIAEYSFGAELAFSGCVKAESVIKLADARAYRWWKNSKFGWNYKSERPILYWIAIEFTPALPFSTQSENTRYFGFDQNGCLTKWNYS